jgi:hypothetical protein
MVKVGMNGMCGIEHGVERDIPGYHARGIGDQGTHRPKGNNGDWEDTTLSVLRPFMELPWVARRNSIGAQPRALGHNTVGVVRKPHLSPSSLHDHQVWQRLGLLFK